MCTVCTSDITIPVQHGLAVFELVGLHGEELKLQDGSKFGTEDGRRDRKGQYESNGKD